VGRFWPDQERHRNMRPKLVADLVDQGVVLTGGGALLPGLDVYLSNS